MGNPRLAFDKDGEDKRQIFGPDGEGVFPLEAWQFPEDASVERHGQHIGQEGLPEGGSQPGYTHVPGSIGGGASEPESGREPGLSPHRPDQYSETEEYEQIAMFFNDMQEIDGVEVLAAHTASGAFKESPTSETSYELSVDMVYEGNGEAEKTVAEQARRWNQWGTFIFSTAALKSARGQKSVATRFQFEEPVKPSLRAEIETTLAKNGTSGWTWKQRSGKDVLVVTAIPQWGYQRRAHQTSMRRLNEYLMGQGVKYGSWARSGRVITATQDDDYAWK